MKLVLSTDNKNKTKEITNLLKDLDIEVLTKSDIGFNIANAKKNRGDFIEHHLAKELDQPVFNQRVADIYQNYAKGQTLIFCVNVHHAEEIAKLIPGAVALSGKTPLDVRKNVIERFKNKEIY